MLAQRTPLIFGAEQATALQFRHDLAGEILKAGGQQRRNDVEAVGGLAGEPFLDLVGDLPGGADDQMMTAHHAEP